MNKAAKTVFLVLGFLVVLAAFILVGVNGFVAAMYGTYYAQSQQEMPIPNVNSGFIAQDLDYVDAASEKLPSASVEVVALSEAYAAADVGSVQPSVQPTVTFTEDDSPADVVAISDKIHVEDAELSESEGIWLFSGYMVGDEPSPVLRRNEDGSITRILIAQPDGQLYKGHGSGITSTSDRVYLTCDGGYFVLALADVLRAGEDDVVQVKGKVDLPFSPAFLNVQQGMLYAGEFHRLGNYETADSHKVVGPGGTQNSAIMCAYGLLSESIGEDFVKLDETSDEQPFGLSMDVIGEFSDKPACVFSIPDLVQGMCLTPDGNFVFSTSYGLATSKLMVFKPQQDRTVEVQAQLDYVVGAIDLPEGVVDVSTSVDVPFETWAPMFKIGDVTVPLYHFDSSNLLQSISAPPMTEGIESHDGRVFVSEEAASNKYVFGKLYGSGYVRSLVID